MDLATTTSINLKKEEVKFNYRFIVYFKLDIMAYDLH